MRNESDIAAERRKDRKKGREPVPARWENVPNWQMHFNLRLTDALNSAKGGSRGYDVANAEEEKATQTKAMSDPAVAGRSLPNVLSNSPCLSLIPNPRPNPLCP
jgi:hypothetical protein